MIPTEKCRFPYLLVLWSVPVLPAERSSSAVKAALSTQHTDSYEGMDARLTDLPGWKSMVWRTSWFLKSYTGGTHSMVVAPLNTTCWFMQLNVKVCSVEVSSISPASSSHCLQDQQERILNLQTLVTMKVPPMMIMTGPRIWVHSKVLLAR